MNEGVTEAYALQEQYCNDHGVPIFINRDCRCVRCGRNIFGEGGHSAEYAGKSLITSCPYCNASFCE